MLKKTNIDLPIRIYKKPMEKEILLISIDLKEECLTRFSTKKTTPR
jgi:hypothetical protein